LIFEIICVDREWGVESGEWERGVADSMYENDFA
jgi:hypothetical protein